MREDEAETDRLDAKPSAEQPLCLLVFSEGAAVRHPLRRGETVVGRSSTATLRLMGAGVSRRHAVLHLGDALRIEDCGSVNGTRVCGRILERGERIDLSPGDVIQLGESTMIVERAEAHAPVQVSPAEILARAQVRAVPGGAFTIARLSSEGGEGGGGGPSALVTEALRGADAFARASDGWTVLVHAPAEEAEVRLRRAAELLARSGAPVRLGVAAFPRDGRDAASLLRRADAALADDSSARTERPLELAEGAMREVYGLAYRVAESDLPVLIVGETGAGKEILAELIHRRSRRAGPFLCLNCAALPEALLESELFGHERGAFTGAVASKPGLLEAAQGGTVFLDEIGELPAAIQAKLLRVFESQNVLRVGAVKPRPIQVRFLAATNRDLEAEATAGRFRRDLYYRLNGMTIAVPPLRERVGEIPRLARFFLESASRRANRRPIPSLSPEAVSRLVRHSWPGNVRELRNVVERALILCAGDVVEAEHLTGIHDQSGDARAVDGAGDGATGQEARLVRQLEELDRRRLEEALERCAGNQTRAAKLLGIARNTLIARMEAYGLRRPRKNPSGR